VAFKLTVIYLLTYKKENIEVSQMHNKEELIIEVI